MLKKRIIPCLDIKDGQTVKGVNFINLKNAGDPLVLATKYEQDGADELVFLDITATVEERKTFEQLVRNIAQVLSIPFTVGGGISNIQDVSSLLTAGADKVSINSAAVKDPNLVTALAKEFGSQCVVVAVDTKSINTMPTVHVKGGREAAKLQTIDWVKRLEDNGAGEILLTSMDADGTKQGFDLDITKAVCDTVNIPVIASGGAGKAEDFVNVFKKTSCTGALAASVFHFGEIPIRQLKQYLASENIPVRLD